MSRKAPADSPANDVNAPCDDEISLVDLIVALWQQRWIIGGVTLLVAVLGTVFAVQREAQYDYVTVVEPGTRVFVDEVEPVATPEDLVRDLERLHVPAARQRFADDADNAGVAPRVRTQLEGEQVRLVTRAPADERERVAALHRSVVELLSAYYHGRSQAGGPGEEAGQWLASSLQGQAELLTRRLAQIQEQQQALQAEVVELRFLVERARERLFELPEAGAARDDENALQRLLIAGEFQRTRDRLDDIEYRLTHELPHRQARLHARLNEIRETGAAGEMRQNGPVGASTTLLIVLSLILAVMLGLFAAAATGLARAASERIRRP